MTHDLCGVMKNEWNGTIFNSFGSNHGRGVSILIKGNSHISIKLVFSCDEGRIVIIQADVDDKKFLLVNIYAPTEKRGKELFFLKLEKIVTDCSRKIDGSKFIIVGGDFNCINDPRIDVNGNKTLYKQPTSFLQFLKRFKMIDIWRKIHTDKKQYTYRSKHLNMSSRIDFWLVEVEHIEYFKNACIKPVSMCPDHCAITLSITLPGNIRGSSYWKLNNSLLKNDSYKDGIVKIIRYTKLENRSKFNQQYMWDLCKIRIKKYTISFAKKLKQSQRKDLIALERKLEELQENVVPDEEEIERVKQQINTHYKRECDGAKVRSRVTHFEESESNSSYFLNLEKRNGRRKCISSIKIGNRIETDIDRISKHVAKSFSNLYTSRCPDPIDIDAYLSGINHPRLSDNDASECEEPISLTELTKALKSMNINKSPGIDGLTVEFYREFWEEIQLLVLESLNEGFKQGKLSYLQRKGIITLLFKGGDATELGNWRPITLLNTDYKILATVLANRLQKMLVYLINDDQVGYIKGRSGICNARLIQDVLDYSAFNEIEGAVIFVDFRKAFDTLEWNFIDACLKKYGFKNNFRKWISVMYCNPHLNIMTNGFLTKDIIPTRGIRQGCPISALLFILSTEALANEIRQRNEIEGLQFGKTMKLLQLADDMTLFVRTVESGTTAIRIIKNFVVYSGIEINENKTKPLWLGSKTPRINISNMPWEEVFVKSLGIYYSRNKYVSLEMNWSNERIFKIKQILNLWKQRNLTLKGKIIILKSLIMSKVLYTSQVLSCPKEIVKELDTLFFDFLWGGKPAKVKRSNMLGEIQGGGLNMLDVHTKIASLGINWLCKYLNDDLNENSKTMFNHWFGKIGGVEIIMSCKYCVRNIMFLESKMPFFYSNMIMTFFVLKDKHSRSTNQNAYNLHKEMIWLNKNILFKQKMLFYLNWINSNILYVGDLMNDNGFLTINEIKAKIVRKDGRWYSQYSCIRKAIEPLRNYETSTEERLHHREYLKSKCKNPLNSEIMLFDEMIPSQQLTTKRIYNELIKWKTEKSRAEEFWFNDSEKSFNPVWPNVWLFKLKSIKDNLLINFNFKFMYNILSTPSNLFKWKINTSDLCYYCNDQGDIMHMFFLCEEITTFWTEVEKVLRKHFISDFKLKHMYIIFGYDLSSRNKKDIDIILNYAMFSIYKSFVKKEKRTKHKLKNILYYLLKYRFEVETNCKRKPIISVKEWKKMLNL